MPGFGIVVIHCHDPKRTKGQNKATVSTSSTNETWTVMSQLELGPYMSLGEKRHAKPVGAHKVTIKGVEQWSGVVDLFMQKSNAIFSHICKVMLNHVKCMFLLCKLIMPCQAGSDLT